MDQSNDKPHLKKSPRRSATPPEEQSAQNARARSQLSAEPANDALCRSQEENKSNSKGERTPETLSRSIKQQSTECSPKNSQSLSPTNEKQSDPQENQSANDVHLRRNESHQSSHSKHVHLIRKYRGAHRKLHGRRKKKQEINNESSKIESVPQVSPTNQPNSEDLSKEQELPLQPSPDSKPNESPKLSLSSEPTAKDTSGKQPSGKTFSIKRLLSKEPSNEEQASPKTRVLSGQEKDDAVSSPSDPTNKVSPHETKVNTSKRKHTNLIQNFLGNFKKADRVSDTKKSSKNSSKKKVSSAKSSGNRRTTKGDTIEEVPHLQKPLPQPHSVLDLPKPQLKAITMHGDQSPSSTDKDHLTSKPVNNEKLSFVDPETSLSSDEQTKKFTERPPKPKFLQKLTKFRRKQKPTLKDSPEEGSSSQDAPVTKPFLADIAKLKLPDFVEQLKTVPYQSHQPPPDHAAESQPKSKDDDQGTKKLSPESPPSDNRYPREYPIKFSIPIFMDYPRIHKKKQSKDSDGKSKKSLPPQRSIPSSPSASSESSSVSNYFSKKQQEEKRSEFEPIKVRHCFLKVMYAILVHELSLSLGIVAVFVFWKSLSDWIRIYFYLVFIPSILYLVTYVLLIVVEKLRKKSPINGILLFLLVSFRALALAMLSAIASTRIIFWSMVILLAVFACMLILVCQTQYKITTFGGIFFALLVVLIAVVCIALLTNTLIYMITIAGFIVFFYCLYVVFDLGRMTSGRHSAGIKPNNYMLAAICLETDLVTSFYPAVLFLYSNCLCLCLCLGLIEEKERPKMKSRDKCTIQ